MASTDNLADRFDVSGPAHIMSRATASHPSTTMIDWLRNIYGSIIDNIMFRATSGHPSTTMIDWLLKIYGAITDNIMAIATADHPSRTMIDWLRKIYGSITDNIMSKATAGHLSPAMIDWNNEEDQRCVAACMVQGTYTLENDRTNCRMHEDALAPPWWENFNFRLVEVLEDEPFNNQFIFGAIFEHVPLAEAPRHPSAPRYIVAFRGAMPYHPKIIQDIHLDLNVIANTLPSCKRSNLACLAVAKLLATITKGKTSSVENCTLWLTGHSVGASLALDVGRAMMSDQGLNIPTFLFNPPQVSLGPAINLLLPSDVVWREMQVASNLVKAGLGLVLNPHRRRMEALFERLSSWVPNLYVHDKDLVCQGFINYFEQRQQMQERFSVGVAKSSTTLSYRDMLFSAVGKEKERPHLLPSATLWMNSSMRKDVQGLQQTSLAAHELQQWWKPDAELGLRNRRYSLP